MARIGAKDALIVLIFIGSAANVAFATACPSLLGNHGITCLNNECFRDGWFSILTGEPQFPVDPNGAFGTNLRCLGSTSCDGEINFEVCKSSSFSPRALTIEAADTCKNCRLSGVKDFHAKGKSTGAYLVANNGSVTCSGASNSCPRRMDNAAGQEFQLLGSFSSGWLVRSNEFQFTHCAGYFACREIRGLTTERMEVSASWGGPRTVKTSEFIATGYRGLHGTSSVIQPLNGVLVAKILGYEAIRFTKFEATENSKMNVSFLGYRPSQTGDGRYTEVECFARGAECYIYCNVCNLLTLKYSAEASVILECPTPSSCTSGVKVEVYDGTQHSLELRGFTSKINFVTSVTRRRRADSVHLIDEPVAFRGRQLEADLSCNDHRECRNFSTTACNVGCNGANSCSFLTQRPNSTCMNINLNCAGANSCEYADILIERNAGPERPLLKAEGFMAMHGARIYAPPARLQLDSPNSGMDAEVYSVSCYGAQCFQNSTVSTSYASGIGFESFAGSTLRVGLLHCHGKHSCKSTTVSPRGTSIRVTLSGYEAGYLSILRGVGSLTASGCFAAKNATIQARAQGITASFLSLDSGSGALLDCTGTTSCNVNCGGYLNGCVGLTVLVESTGDLIIKDSSEANRPLVLTPSPAPTSSPSSSPTLAPSSSPSKSSLAPSSSPNFHFTAIPTVSPCSSAPYLHGGVSALFLSVLLVTILS